MRVAFVFPGQGAQGVGMGRGLHDASPEARAVLEAADAACGGALLPLCFDGPEETLRDTRHSQPAIFAVSCAALAAVRACGIAPDAVAGHSIGEYAALHAAGVFDLETGLRVVRARAEAMAEAAEARPGGMAAVLGLDAAAVAEVCGQTEGVVVPANLNSPGQIVISGETAALAAAGEALKAAGAKRVVPLAVSGAFHSPLMEPAARRLEAALAAETLADPTIPVVANVTADVEATAAEVASNLVAQVPGQVRWIETVERLCALGCEAFVECGPGSALAGLIRRIAPQARTWSVNDAASLQRLREEWTAG